MDIFLVDNKCIKQDCMCCSGTLNRFHLLKPWLLKVSHALSSIMEYPRLEYVDAQELSVAGHCSQLVMVEFFDLPDVRTIFPFRSAS